MKTIAIVAATALVMLVGLVSFISYRVGHIGALPPIIRQDQPFAGPRDDRLQKEAYRSARSALGPRGDERPDDAAQPVARVTVVARVTGDADLPAPVVPDWAVTGWDAIWSPARYADGRSGTYVYSVQCVPGREAAQRPDRLRVSLIAPERTEVLWAVPEAPLYPEDKPRRTRYSNHWEGGPTVTPAGDPVSGIGEPASWTWLTLRTSKPEPGLAGLVIRPRPDVVQTLLPRRADDGAVVVAGWTTGRAKRSATEVTTLTTKGKAAKALLGDDMAAGTWKATWRVGRAPGAANPR
jgi:hypothetical protein